MSAVRQPVPERRNNQVVIFNPVGILIDEDLIGLDDAVAKHGSRARINGVRPLPEMQCLLLWHASLQSSAVVGVHQIVRIDQQIDGMQASSKRMRHVSQF